ncbi:MAG: alpha/beta hydrolase [Chlorobi bacterium]|nr:alpha/beta hydrolase [Chlorobiota bacterium]
MPYIQVRGCNYYYIDEGKGDETIVFAHGFLLDADMFRFQIDYFKNRYRIIAFDWRGQGRSEKTTNGYDIDSLYLDSIELLMKLNCTPCHWVGLSMGGFVGMRIVARKPELIKSLILADTGASEETFINKIKWGTLAILFRLFGLHPVKKGVLKALFSPHSLKNPNFKSIITEYAHKMEKQDRKTIYKIAWAIFNRKSVIDELHKIKAPSLVMVGEDDIARPVEEAKQLVELIPNAELKIIPNAGHSSALENPQEFNKAMETFLKKVSNAN